MYLVVKTIGVEVFWGRCEGDPDGETIVLLEARQVCRWTEETRCLAGLAASGPADGSTVTPVVARVTLRRPDLVLVASEIACERWRRAGWGTP